MLETGKIIYWRYAWRWERLATYTDWSGRQFTAHFDITDEPLDANMRVDAHRRETRVRIQQCSACLAPLRALPLVASNLPSPPRNAQPLSRAYFLTRYFEGLWVTFSGFMEYYNACESAYTPWMPLFISASIRCTLILNYFIEWYNLSSQSNVYCDMIIGIDIDMKATARDL